MVSEGRRLFGRGWRGAAGRAVLGADLLGRFAFGSQRPAALHLQLLEVLSRHVDAAQLGAERVLGDVLRLLRLLR